MSESDFTILAIDTSCDDTSVAITRGRRVLTNSISSQIEMHKKSGGVIPIEAARAHDIKLDPLIKFAFKKAKLEFKDINAIAVTFGPGLAPALEVGIHKAKELSLSLNIPLIPVNHMAGHTYANWAENSKGGVTSPQPSPTRRGNKGEVWPKMALLVSGGHTEIILLKSHHNFEIIGETLDDACGECFDKVGRMIGLGYPAGPVIEKMAKEGDSDKYELPRPMQNTNDFNVSYSGLKTAAFRLIKTLHESNVNIDHDLPLQDTKTKAPPGTEVFLLTREQILDVSASFQKAAIGTIMVKLEKALRIYPVTELVLGGGVVQNKYLRKEARKIAEKFGINFYYPPRKLIMDNAAMIGIAAFYQYFHTPNTVLMGKERIEKLERVPGLRL